MLLILALIIMIVTACHPESRWACDDPCGIWICDDPICTAKCEAICETKCICFNPDTNSSIGAQCGAWCPTDQCESDSCPVCDTVCYSPCVSGYSHLCEATNCTWKCKSDPSCPKPKCNKTEQIACEHPRCELMSEMPACEYNTGRRVSLF